MDPIDVIRREVRFTGPADALLVVASVSRQRLPSSATLVFLDDDRRLIDFFMIDGGADHLAELVEFTCSPDEPEVSALFIVTDRTGEVPADRPDDELRWLELVDLAATGATTLLDWFVVWGTHAFSVAEHALRPAQW